MRRPDRAGFTAIELVIVVTIIGILAATGIGKYQHYTTVARRSSCLANQDQILAAVKAVEADRGALDPNTVMRFWYNGVIDDAHIAPSLATSQTNYRTWVGAVPPGWSPTFNGTTSAQNDTVLAKAQDTQIFRCPEDIRISGPQYTRYSKLSGMEPEPESSPLSQTYTYAKMVVTPRSGFAFDLGGAADDPLEGYNWMTQSIEWNNSTFVFCRRWGRRDSGIAGTGVLNNATTDSSYLPVQERLMAHTAAVSTAR
ncbi:MAG: type II secretion system protein [Candidatus Riflebacteria bacterium]|nr:type II secretion system protein [Candidatus Riflebacteria bacterium]